MDDSTDGVIKYDCRFTLSADIGLDQIKQLNDFRGMALAEGWIGVGSDGIGFGNISVRTSIRSFLISGSQTGHIAVLGVDGYSQVTDWNIDGNRIECQGLCKASSESMSHAAIYEEDKAIGAVIHIHSKELWDSWTNILTRTECQIPYGTPQMARNLQRCMHESHMVGGGVLCMGGHMDGIIAWGDSLSEAWKYLKHIRSNPA